MSYIRYLCLFTYNGVQNILCCGFILGFFRLATSFSALSIFYTKRSKQNPQIEEDQTAQNPKERRQQDKQRSTKHTHQTKDQVTRTPLKTGGELYKDKTQL